MIFDDRASYDAMLDEAWLGTFQSRDAGRRLVKLLRDAEQARVPWAVAELEELLIDGAMAKCRTWKQDRRPKVPTREGVEVKQSGGARERDESTGEVSYVQLAFEDMTRIQLTDHVRMLSRQVRTHRASIAAIRRLLKVLNQVPEASTPREACVALGTTVESVMAGETAA